MIKVVVALGVCVCLVPMARAEEIVLECLQDAEVDEEEPNTNKGAGADIMIGATWGEPELFRAYGLFEFEDLEIPAESGILINQAILTLFIVSNGNDAEADIYTVAEEWEEMSVTWNTKPEENTNVVVTDTAPPLEPPVQPWEIDVTEIVRMWYEPDHLIKHGFYIDIPDNGEWVDIDVASRDHPDTMLHPRLWIEGEFTGVCEDEGTFDKSLTVSQVSPGIVEISCHIPDSILGSIKVYDAAGTLVESIIPESGTQTVSWQSSPGVYFVRLVSGNVSACMKFVVVN